MTNLVTNSPFSWTEPTSFVCGLASLVYQFSQIETASSLKCILSNSSTHFNRRDHNWMYLSIVCLLFVYHVLFFRFQTRGRSLSLTKGEIHISMRYEHSRARLNIIVLKASNLLKTSKFLTTGR